jgi:hypothetical protein
LFARFNEQHVDYHTGSFVTFESFGAFVRDKQLGPRQKIWGSHDGVFSRTTSLRHFSTSEMSALDGKKPHRAFIALGSNMGDRITAIERACLMMERTGIKIKRTSSLFETAPMYVLDQEPFINAACEVCVISYQLLRIDFAADASLRLRRTWSQSSYWMPFST